jgi:ribosomal-protein-alanine N-acetyltransferase
MSLIVRKATDRDLPDLLQLIKPFRSPAFNWSEELFRSEFSNVQTWVLEKDHQDIVAFACLRDAVDAWEISILATHQDYHGQGCMQALLEDLVRKFGGERHFWLEVHEKNVAAQKLYEKMGFQHDGHRGGYYSDGSSALLYSLPKKQTPS